MTAIQYKATAVSKKDQLDKLTVVAKKTRVDQGHGKTIQRMPALVGDQWPAVTDSETD